MKTTVVPAQITTVEDKIAGNLSITQLMLLTAPVYLSGLIFAFLPPLVTLTPIKVVFCTLVAVFCLLLAVRFKGKILLSWLVVIARYNRRPRHYVFNKNDGYLRETEPTSQPAATKEPSQIRLVRQKQSNLTIPIAELVRLQSAVDDPRAGFHFKTTRKGLLRVHIKQVK